MICFKAKTNLELVELLNKEISNEKYSSAKEYFLSSLKNEFNTRGINISSILNEDGYFKLGKQVRLLNDTVLFI